MKLSRLLEEGTAFLESRGVPDARLDARRLLLEAFRTDLVHFLMDQTREIDENEESRRQERLYREMIKRRGRRIPLQQILGSQAFMGLDFLVNEQVLIPRQDTETLAELALLGAETFSEPSLFLLDLCTGSGCLAVSLAARGPFARVTATDISGEALKVAAENARRLLPGWKIRTEDAAGEAKPDTGAEPLIEFRKGDLFQALSPGEYLYDMIVSNPPYIPSAVIPTLEPEVRDHEPLLALDGAEDGLACYRRIAAEAGRYLKPGGQILLEIGYDQGEAVRRLLADGGFEKTEVCRDLAGRDRVVKAFWPGKQSDKTAEAAGID